MAGKAEGRKDKPLRDLRAELTEQLLTAMEKKDAWWQKPWDMGEMEMPFNAVTDQHPTLSLLYLNNEDR